MGAGKALTVSASATIRLVLGSTGGEDTRLQKATVCLRRGAIIG
jgi:hypothetical protein